MFCCNGSARSADDARGLLMVHIPHFGNHCTTACGNNTVL